MRGTLIMGAWASGPCHECGSSIEEHEPHVVTSDAEHSTYAHVACAAARGWVPSDVEATVLARLEES